MLPDIAHADDPDRAHPVDWPWAACRAVALPVCAGNATEAEQAQWWGLSRAAVALCVMYWRCYLTARGSYERAF
jgi:hypothetical protein